MKVQTYINEGPGMFTGYQHGVDRLVIGPVVDTTADDRTPAADILDGTVWHVGNRMAADAAGNAWPNGVRSLSVGDVVAIPEREVAYAVTSDGWEVVTGWDIRRSLSEGVENPAMAEARLHRAAR